MLLPYVGFLFVFDFDQELIVDTGLLVLLPGFLFAGMNCS